MDASRENLLYAAMEGVRRYGLDGVTMRQIAALGGVSVGYAYTHFDSKNDMMRACFEHVDRQIAALFDTMDLTPKQVAQDPRTAVCRLWVPYFRWLVSHPDETVFYHQYRNHPDFPAFHKTRDISYFAAFVRTIDTYESVFHMSDKVAPAILWEYILSTTVMFAKQVVEGVLPNTAATEQDVLKIMLYGMAGLVLPAEDLTLPAVE